MNCGQTDFLDEPIKVETQQVAQLVAQPIEVVEYHRHRCQCKNCSQETSADLPPEMIQWTLSLIHI